jgi:hypothetical protein
MRLKTLRDLLPWIIIPLMVSLLLALVDPRGKAITGFLAYLSNSFICTFLFWFSWRALAGLERPRWLLLAVLLALAMRLGLGALLRYGLPQYGYGDSRPHQAGYIYKDAYQRDVDAWQLAISDKPLVSAWQGDSSSDQYGGLLYLSALIYRTVSVDVRRPILIILLTATVGSLCVLFTWSFTNRLFGARAAKFAAWLVAFYPEAVLLGASQMREPFLMTALALGFEAYALYRLKGLKPSWPYWCCSLALALLISPPYALIILGIAVLAWLWEGRGDAKQIAISLGLLLIIGLVALALTLRAWAMIEGGPDGNLIDLVRWWMKSGAGYQLHLLEQSSGWVHTIFEQVPDWGQMPLATLYGLVQPFLPAAIMDNTSVPLIRAIVAFRALGWFFLLPFLIYAPLAAIRYRGWRSLETYLALLLWAAALLVSYRDAGRLWDNPRWRSVFLCIQAAMAAWAWVTAGEKKDPWLRRMGGVVAIPTLVFLHWEMGRYYHTPRLSFWKTLGLGAGVTVLYLMCLLAFDRYTARRRKA